MSLLDTLIDTRTLAPPKLLVYGPPGAGKTTLAASAKGVLSDQVVNEKYPVRDVTYSVHTKRGADDDAPKTMRVDYRIGLARWVSEWVCFEHEGYARWKAEQWWQARSNDPIPDTAQRAVDIANGGGVCWTEAITVRSVPGEPFERIVDHELSPKPNPAPLEEALDYDESELPF